MSKIIFPCKFLYYLNPIMRIKIIEISNQCYAISKPYNQTINEFQNFLFIQWNNIQVDQKYLQLRKIIFISQLKEFISS